jgi:hypothetical protein
MVLFRIGLIHAVNDREGAFQILCKGADREKKRKDNEFGSGHVV